MTDSEVAHGGFSGKAHTRKKKKLVHNPIQVQGGGRWEGCL